MSISHTTMIHAAAEALTIGGLAFVFHRRMTAAETKLEEMEAKLGIYEKHIANQQRGLENVYQILQTIGTLTPESRRTPPRPSPPSLSGEDLDNMLKEELGEVVGEEPEELIIGEDTVNERRPKPKKKAHTNTA